MERTRLEELARRRPRDARLWLRLAELRERDGEAVAAASAYQQSARSFAAAAHERHAAAILARALKLAPHDAELRMTLAELYLRLGWADRASDALRSVLGLLAESDAEAALDLLARIVALAPRDLAAAEALIRRLRSAGRREEAAAAADTLLAAVDAGTHEARSSAADAVLHELPDHVPALLVRAHALRERGDEVLAAREIASALLRRPAETALHEMHVELLESLGDAAGARDARLALVDLHRERGETERVRELLQRCGGELEGALGASPPGPAPTDRFACFAPAEAVEDPDTRCDLAVGYLQVEAYRRALDELHPLLGAAEHRARVLPLVAAGYAGLGAFGAAAAALEEAIALESEGPEAAPLRYDLGSALSNAGERARALRVFQDTALLHPGFRDVEARIDALERELESEGAAC